jgi:uncharacterized protein (TIGR02246 family)
MSDEQEIRQVISTWISATRSGDVATVLSLMSDDVVFLLPGREPMRKEEFAAMSKQQSGERGPKIDAVSEIQEIQVLGDWAFMWTRLKIVITPPGAAKSMTRAGHTLSVLKKENGKWLLARDANMLAPE